MRMTFRPQSDPLGTPCRDTPWKEDLLPQLQTRNRNQRDCFTAVFSTSEKLFAYCDTLEKRKEVRVPADNWTEIKSSDWVQTLQRKIDEQQKAILENHRNRTDSMKELEDLRKELDVKSCCVQGTERRLLEKDTILLGMKEAIKQSESALLEMEKSNNLLKLELQALRSAHIDLDEKFRNLSESYQELHNKCVLQERLENDRKSKETETKQFSLLESLLHNTLLKTRTLEKKMDFSSDYLTRMPAAYCVSVPSVPKSKDTAHDGAVNAIRWSPSGRLFATGGADYEAKLWQAASHGIECRTVLSGSNAGITSVDFDPAETFLAGSSNDRSIRIWSLRSQTLQETLTGHTGNVSACKFAASSCRIISGSHDRTLKLWDLQSRSCVQTFSARSACNDIVVVGSRIMASGHHDGKLRMWDMRKDNSIAEVALDAKITSLDTSTDSSYVLVCSRDDTLKVIDLRTYDVLHSFEADGFHVGCDWLRAVFSPDGQFVMAGSSTGVLFVWNFETKNRRRTNVERLQDEHITPITACSWHPQGNQLLSCDRGGKVVIWSDY